MPIAEDAEAVHALEQDIVRTRAVMLDESETRLAPREAVARLGVEETLQVFARADVRRGDLYAAVVSQPEARYPRRRVVNVRVAIVQARFPQSVGDEQRLALLDLAEDDLCVVLVLDSLNRIEGGKDASAREVGRRVHAGRPLAGAAVRWAVRCKKTGLGRT